MYRKKQKRERLEAARQAEAAAKAALEPLTVARNNAISAKEQADREWLPAAVALIKKP